MTTSMPSLNVKKKVSKLQCDSTCTRPQIFYSYRGHCLGKAERGPLSSDKNIRVAFAARLLPLQSDKKRTSFSIPSRTPLKTGGDTHLGSFKLWHPQEVDSPLPSNAPRGGQAGGRFHSTATCPLSCPYAFVFFLAFHPDRNAAGCSNRRTRSHRLACFTSHARTAWWPAGAVLCV